MLDTVGPTPWAQGLLFVWIILSYTVAGLIAWWRRPHNRFGPLLIATGFAAFLASLTFSSNEALLTVGQLFDLVLTPLILHVLLAFPTGRLAGRRSSGRWWRRRTRRPSASAGADAPRRATERPGRHRRAGRRRWPCSASRRCC